MISAEAKLDLRKKNPAGSDAGGVFSFFKIKNLAVTYFHIVKDDTIIGAERFHFRVRKGIGWFPLAMAARQNGCRGTSHVSPRRQFGQFVYAICRIQDQLNPQDLHVRTNRLGVIWSSLTGN